MPERREGPEDIPTSERMGTMVTSKASGIRYKLVGEGEATATHYMVEDWPAAPKKGARQMLEQYGEPNEATPSLLIWHRNGPWKRTIVSRDEIVHDFPTTHTDYITQVVDYRIPPERCDDIAAFDGSCLVDRTAGEAAARCDAEAMNILTLNLMHGIVTGATSVEEARKIYAENAAAHTLGRSAPLTERLQVPEPEGKTADRDQQMIGGAMARQMAEKAKDAME